MFCWGEGHGAQERASLVLEALPRAPLGFLVSRAPWESLLLTLRVEELTGLLTHVSPVHPPKAIWESEPLS